MVKKICYFILLIIVVFVVIYIWKSETINENANSEMKSLTEPHQGKLIDERKKVVDITDNDALAIDKVIKQMSIDEKIGQMIFAGISGTTLTKETESLIGKYKVGGIILFANNLENPEQSIELLNQIKTENRQNELPILLGVDQEGGRVERLPSLAKLPSSREIAARNNEELSYEIGVLLAEQLHAFGFNVNFAPVLDINSNPNNPVIGDRSFGDNPEIVNKLGIQTMEGMQSKNIITAVKHFPGHGDTDVDSHLELPKVEKSLKKLEELELIPFKHAIEVGTDIVMTAHILLPEIDSELPASMSEKVIAGILREQLGFDGVVITDDMTMQAITDHYDIGEAAVDSIKAGTDIILMAHDYEGLVSVFDMLKEAVIGGEISEDRIDESLRRIIRLKREYKIADEQVESIDIEGLNEMIEKVLDE